MNKKTLNTKIFIFFIFGIFITVSVESAIDSAKNARIREEKKRMETVPSPRGETFILEEQGEDGIGPGINYEPEHETKKTAYEEFSEKFRETDLALLEMKVQKEEMYANLSAKSDGTAELRYWETQLNSLYRSIMAELSDEEAAVLAVSQQDWRRQRDMKSAKAALHEKDKTSHGAEYIVRQVEATKERAYELLEKYRDRLE